MAELSSVVLTTYNRAELLSRAVQSVASQTWANLDVLIVDDCSTDNTPQIAEALQRRDARITYLRMDTNRGNAAARNAGLRRCKGDFIAFMDDDDIWIDSDKLRKQIAAFRINPECDLVCTGVRLHHNSYMCRTETDFAISESRLLVGNGLIYNSTVVIRREVLEKRSGFDERLTRGIDSDFYRGILTSNGKVYCLADVTTSVQLASPHRMTQRADLRRITEVFRNNILTFRKYRKAFARDPISVVLRLTRIARRVIRRLLPLQLEPVALVKTGAITNLGDEMMLRSVEAKLAEGYAIAVLYGSVSLRVARDRGWLVILPPLPVSASHPKALVISLASRTLNRMPLRLLRRLGFGRTSDVRAYFDASGYAYGAPWSEAKLLRGASLMEGFPDAARFLLPQSLGALTTESAQIAGARLLQASHLAFGRDLTSVSNWAEPSRRSGVALTQAPDFTVMLPISPTPHKDQSQLDSVVLLPNHRAEEILGFRAFHDFFLLCAREAQMQGFRVIVATHDTKHDRNTALRVADALGGNAIAVVDIGLDNLQTMVAQSKFVVSSRFHGILNAYRHEVPVIALGWTNKFEEVMTAFDSRRFSFRGDYRPANVSAACVELLNSTANDAHRARISRALTRAKKDVAIMWRSIDEKLGRCDCDSRFP